MILVILLWSSFALLVGLLGVLVWPTLRWLGIGMIGGALVIGGMVVYYIFRLFKGGRHE